MACGQSRIVSPEQLNKQKEYAQKVKEILSQKGKPLFAYIRTYGCQQNVSDSEKIKGMALQMGYQLTDSSDLADLIIFNTCAVRENAEDHVFGNLGALKNQKRANPDLLIGVCGCMTQQSHIAQKIKTSYPYVNMVFGTHVMHTLPEMIFTALSKQKRIFSIEDSEGVIVEGLPAKRDGSLKAGLPIMYGCNNFCTYCIVPFVRGRERSRTSEEIVKEFSQLVQEGYKEITLLGQNVNSYGKGLEESIGFPQLLERLNAIEGDFRIRFMTSHPKDATKELIDTIAKCDKVCKHFHLPVQSGSDRVLKLMNRGYTIKQYLEFVDYARAKIPSISFTSDIIVGFPTETYEDFQQTLELIREVRYDALFTFIYSKRVGTKAAAMEDPIPSEQKSKWFQELLDTQSQLGQGKLDHYVGKTYRILVDGKGKTSDEYLTGRTDSNIIVDFPSNENLIGQFVNITITKALNWALLGEL